MDCGYNKVESIFVNSEDTEAVKAYLLANFRTIKEIFDYWAWVSKYPQIHYTQYVEFCETWQLVTKGEKSREFGKVYNAVTDGMLTRY